MAHPISADLPTVGGRQAMTDTWGHRGKASRYTGLSPWGSGGYSLTLL